MRPAPESPAPHLDPTTWCRLVDSLDAATIFVVIGSWIGAEVRLEISVEDIWQETLWMAWRDRQQHEWSSLSKYRAWLLGIAHNRVRAAVRGVLRTKRGGSRPLARFSDLGGADTVDGYLPPQSTTPSRTASHLERARVLEHALAALDEPLRDVVRLRVFEEVPLKDSAERLGLPLSTFKDRLVRGMRDYRRELQRRLGADAHEPRDPA
ncbi:MAG: sigma-70 family RNA polymerase sigma factor [Planctomycetes bacterium]|nr:sigma-70 family RNA polymerase sigma factor [Planctomycetota bacterium]